MVLVLRARLWHPHVHVACVGDAIMGPQRKRGQQVPELLLLFMVVVDAKKGLVKLNAPPADYKLCTRRSHARSSDYMSYQPYQG